MNNIPEGLQKHCPYWYAWLKEIPYTRVGWGTMIGGINQKPNKLNIHSYPHCIVGEKHGWSFNYAPHIISDNNKNCKICFKLSERFALDNEDKFIETLNKFVRHCDRKH